MNFESQKKLSLDPNRPVGWESRKTYSEKIARGFFDTYLSGDSIIELGFRGGLDSTVPIVPQAIGIDRDYPGYDGLHLPFPDNSQDAVYSSHCFEHIADHREALKEWYRVLKVGGYLVLIVPHQHLFERRAALPSIWNSDHKKFYTPAILLKEIEEVLVPNSYRIRHLVDNDKGFDYSVLPDEAGVGCFEIELVLQKLPKPTWSLEDRFSRDYGPALFYTKSGHSDRHWWVEHDFSSGDGCWIWGPYIPLRAGRYDIRFYVEAIGLGEGPLRPDSRIGFDVTADTSAITLAMHELIGQPGADLLRQGPVEIRFESSVRRLDFEFRVFTHGRPFDGALRFYGVSVRYMGITDTELPEPARPELFAVGETSIKSEIDIFAKQLTATVNQVAAVMAENAEQKNIITTAIADLQLQIDNVTRDLEKIKQNAESWLVPLLNRHDAAISELRTWRGTLARLLRRRRANT